jgi:hypothetical protein
MDEYKTSCQSPNEDEGKPEHILWRPSPRPWRRRKWGPVHGLLCCKNTNDLKQGCTSIDSVSYTYWNRDDLSTENMRIIVKRRAGWKRPSEEVL